MQKLRGEMRRTHQHLVGKSLPLHQFGGSNGIGLRHELGVEVLGLRVERNSIEVDLK